MNLKLPLVNVHVLVVISSVWEFGGGTQVMTSIVIIMTMTMMTVMNIQILNTIKILISIVIKCITIEIMQNM